jgi:hypothetical protein
MYVVLDDVEIEDWYAAIRDAGQAPEDFEISETVTGLETGIATVTNRRSRVECTYPIGNLTIFPADFAQDVVQGAFM